jgi:hypothetical protein
MNHNEDFPGHHELQDMVKEYLDEPKQSFSASENSEAIATFTMDI